MILYLYNYKLSGETCVVQEPFINLGRIEQYENLKKLSGCVSDEPFLSAILYLHLPLCISGNIRYYS